MQGDKYAAFLHDAVILYAIALNETYRKGQDINSGLAISRNTRGKTFKGPNIVSHTITHKILYNHLANHYIDE